MPIAKWHRLNSTAVVRKFIPCYPCPPCLPCPASGGLDTEITEDTEYTEICLILKCRLTYAASIDYIFTPRFCRKMPPICRFCTV